MDIILFVLSNGITEFFRKWNNSQ